MSYFNIIIPFTFLISHIQVGRMKIETPTVTLLPSATSPAAAHRSASQDSGHAFILRRFDTGAISLTTMFRAAFPNAPEHDEKAEVQWVKDNYDLSGNNGSSKDNHITRLAGVWVSPNVALELSHAYKIDDIISSVVEAAPDPNGNYRRSGKAAAAAAATSTVNAAPSPPSNAGSALPPPPIQSATKSLPTPSRSSPAPNPLKRRKDSSPAPTPPITSPEVSKPLPRRSARTKSPAPRSAAQMAPLTSLLNQTPKASRSSPKKQDELVVTPGGSEETAVEDVAGSDLHEEDVLEQQKLIADLKAQRDAKKLAEQQQQEEDESMESGDSDEVDGPSKLKRAREEDGPAFKFEFKEPEVVERPVATNSRVRRFTLEPRTKSFAWGLAAFAVGMGAV